MARLTVYVPDALYERVLAELHDVYWSQVLQAGLIQLLADKDDDGGASPRAEGDD